MNDLMFENRRDAALRLAERLPENARHDALVLGIPRGGAITGATLAHAIGADFDVVLSRKLRAEWQSELALGAVGEDGHVVLDEATIAATGASRSYVNAEIEHQTDELRRRAELFRAARPAAPVTGRLVIVTDDGIATGSTMLAALDLVRDRGAREVVAAIPVMPPDRIPVVAARCDDLVCVLAPHYFRAVGQFYEDFAPVSDVEVVEVLRSFAPGGHAGTSRT